jgi:nitroimidazol reductase NimA-like FMN-containing flavoprotein (pyridoxamine 5'-phosphate oxidase superfamily)
MRRTGQVMSREEIDEVLRRGICGRLGTIGTDGFPYVLPMLYVWDGHEIYWHCGIGAGHLLANTSARDQVCFEVDEPGDAFGYGRFECDSSLAYVSVIATGRLRPVDDRTGKEEFCLRLMQKYGSEIEGRPKGFFPRLHHIRVYAIQSERLTGKFSRLPVLEQRWPSVDRTSSPSATIL